MKFPFEFATERQFDVVGFGTNAVDFLITVPKFPMFGSKIELVDYAQAPGGEVATTMVGLQRLGLKTAYIGRFGDDDAGKLGSRSLGVEGVDIAFAEIVAGARTQIAFIVIDAESGERTVIWKRDVRLSYTADEAPIHLARECRLLHLTPHDVDACVAFARHAKACGTVVSMDIDNLFDGINDLLPLVDVLIASSDLPERITGISDRERSLATMQDKFGCAVVGVTLGDRGSLLRCNGEFIYSDGFAVPGGCKDTTGAGDSFRVGLIYGILSGKDLVESSRMANAVAALKCRSVGARTSLPSPDELHNFVS
ncbi:MAG TPA: carbohydrate kinase family protein [Pyrinomonadaceae bacterium]|nr:carbohydrate kinase family protein [Pyrinomonadaceae bacterium]